MSAPPSPHKETALADTVLEGDAVNGQNAMLFHRLRSWMTAPHQEALPSETAAALADMLVRHPADVTPQMVRTVAEQLDSTRRGQHQITPHSQADCMLRVLTHPEFSVQRGVSIVVDLLSRAAMDTKATCVTSATKHRQSEQHKRKHAQNKCSHEAFVMALSKRDPSLGAAIALAVTESAVLHPQSTGNVRLTAQLICECSLLSTKLQIDLLQRLLQTTRGSNASHIIKVITRLTTNPQCGAHIVNAVLCVLEKRLHELAKAPSPRKLEFGAVLRAITAILRPQLPSNVPSPFTEQRREVVARKLIPLLLEVVATHIPKNAMAVLQECLLSPWAQSTPVEAYINYIRAVTAGPLDDTSKHVVDIVADVVYQQFAEDVPLLMAKLTTVFESEKLDDQNSSLQCIEGLGDVLTSYCVNALATPKQLLKVLADVRLGGSGMLSMSSVAAVGVVVRLLNIHGQPCPATFCEWAARQFLAAMKPDITALWARTCTWCGEVTHVGIMFTQSREHCSALSRPSIRQ